MNISRILQEWYQINKRDLPWRNSATPYKVWLSEIILQQTRVNQGLAYYYKFIEKYPEIFSLANAPEDEILKLWQGLGYYSRARNMHATAKEIVEKYDGKFPEDFNSILTLKGVGNYTASAIASIAFNLPYATVDGNVNRVISRLFNIKEPVNETKGQKLIKLKAEAILDKLNPGTHNQALMEFGSLHCTPQKPDCENCPLRDHCLAYINNCVNELPVKTTKVKVKERFFSYLVISFNNTLYIQKRLKKDIWQNLYEFPLIETTKKISAEELLQHNEWKTLFEKKEVNIKLPKKEYTHILSHQKIHAVFYYVEIDSKIQSNNLLLIKRDKIEDYAVPRLIDRYLIDEGYK